MTISIRGLGRGALALLLIAVLAGALPVMCSGAVPAMPQLDAAAVPLDRLLREDGSLDLNSGYKGSVSMAGWQMTVSHDGAPRFERAAGLQASVAGPPTATPGPGTNSSDQDWDDRFIPPPEMDAEVFAMVLDGNGNLYAGGRFTMAGGVSANCVARWNGIAWSSLGSGMSAPGTPEVRSLAVDSSGNLYAGGYFTTAGGVSASRIARWNGSTWSALGSGMSHSVYALVIDASGNLYAGGNFTTAGGVSASRIARWNGSTWSALGSGMDWYVLSLALDASGNLYAGGLFQIADGVNANYIARWDGSTWWALGSGMNNWVYALAIDAGGNLYAGGTFTTAGGVSANGIARWNGSTWSALGSGMNAVYSLAFDVSGNLYAGGYFTTAGGVNANHIARWNGSNWSALGSGMNNWVAALAFNASGNLCAGGFFTVAGGVNASRAAGWDGSTWSTLSIAGTNPHVISLAMDAAGNPYVGGDFTVAGGVSVNRVAYYNGSSFSALGSGTNYFIVALAVSGDGNLYAGGWFSAAGGVTVNYVARWNGAAWSSLGSGMNGSVSALAIDGSGAVYAGGNFTTAGGVNAMNIARWNGTSWSALGSGMNNTVMTLAVDSSGNLYAGGLFTTAGGVAANYVARWNGTSWSALSSGMGGSGPLFVSALTVDASDNLYAGGYFETAGGAGANYVARWNGSTWSGLGLGVNSIVYALALDSGGSLYAGGTFTTAGGGSANYVARWDGFAWYSLGSGTNNLVRTLAVNASGDVYAGGFFTTAGGKSSSHIALWHGAASAFSNSGQALPGLQFSSTAWGDYDNDGDLDLLAAGGDGTGPGCRLFRNTNGTFADMNAGLAGILGGTVAWGDYDGDGDLDIALTGYDGAQGTSRIYRNDAGVFQDVSAGLPGLYATPAAAWGDYDNDGDLDLALAGQLDNGPAITRIYRNDAGTFVDINAGLTGVATCSTAWADYDGDGDLDLTVMGLGSSGASTGIYRNTAGVFADAGASLPPCFDGGISWGDYDNDGDLDLLTCGNEVGTGGSCRVFRNSGGALTDIGAGMTGITGSRAEWGDYDNDGDLDVIAAGQQQNGTGLTRLYRNNGGTFVDALVDLPGFFVGSASFADYDQDGDLDLALFGSTGGGPQFFVGAVYRNNVITANVRPDAPSNLVATRIGTQYTFGWSAGTDDHTPANGLTYNLRVGTTPGGNEVMSALASGSSGYRRVARTGNAQERLSWTLTLPRNQYYWSVQAIDGSFLGSPFAAEKTIGTAFNNSGQSLPPDQWSSAAWGDYDNDGDLDLLLAGEDNSGTGASAGINTQPEKCQVFRNTGGVFTDVNAGLPGVRLCTVAWGDYDRDGDLDIGLTGYDGSLGISRIYRNDAGAFTDIGAALVGLWTSSLAWGDYDNDGDLDLSLVGYSDFWGETTRIYRNDSGTFVDINAGLTGVYAGSTAWVDYDNDGDLDLSVMGYTGVGLTRIYRNTGGVFADAGANLPGAWWGELSWGDYDNDGDQDLLISGQDWSAGFCRIYRNTGGTFTDIGAGMTGVFESCAAWGDYDNDGDLDAIVAGYDGSETGVTKIYRNDGDNTFTDTQAELPGFSTGSVSFADYDNDGDLDLALLGAGGGLFRNDGSTVNARPASPSNLVTARNGNQVTLSWNAASDDYTPAAGLTYNLRVGSSPGVADLMEAMADPATGVRRVAAPGNAQQRLSWTLTIPPATPVYWSVQSIDGSYLGSPFAPDQVSGVGDGRELPAVLTLGPANPNPVARSTRITFAVPERGTVHVDLFDVSGRRVRSLLHGTVDAGWHELDWDGQDASGARAAAGIYFVRLHGAGGGRTLKLVVTR